MQLNQIPESGRVEYSEDELVLVQAGFDLNLFHCDAEVELALREIDRISETKLVRHFGVSPAWIIGDTGPFIGENGVRLLTRAFKLGQELGIDTAEWTVHLTSVEVLDLLPSLQKRALKLTYN